METREAFIALGRRAVNSRAWHNLPGMVNFHGYRLTDEDLVPAVGRFVRFFGVPNLDDITTRSCILPLIRNAKDDDTIITRKHKDGWRVEQPKDEGYWYIELGKGVTELEALVDALERI